MGSLGICEQDDAEAHVDACYLLHPALTRPDPDFETRVEKLENPGELQDLNVLDILGQPLSSTRVKRSPSPKKSRKGKGKRNGNKKNRRRRNRRMRRRRNRNRKRMRN